MRRLNSNSTKTSRPRVFVLEPHDKDFRHAETFGDIEFIFDDGPRPSIWDRALVANALGYLHGRKYNPNVDYVLAVGAMVPMLMFFTALVETWRSPQVLYWDAQHRCYVERRLGRLHYITDSIQQETAL